jgi:hypothetical protein
MHLYGDPVLCVAVNTSRVRFKVCLNSIRHGPMLAPNRPDLPAVDDQSSVPALFDRTEHLFESFVILVEKPLKHLTPLEAFDRPSRI